MGAEASGLPGSPISADRTELPSTSFDPTTVRAHRSQDPAKTGALYPDGQQVQVPNSRPEIERSGGLARTGW